MELRLSEFWRLANNGAKLSLNSIWQRVKNLIAQRTLWFCEDVSAGLFWEQILVLPFIGHSVNGCTHAGRIERIPKRPNFESVELPLSGELVP